MLILPYISQASDQSWSARLLCFVLVWSDPHNSLWPGCGKPNATQIYKKFNIIVITAVYQSLYTRLKHDFLHQHIHQNFYSITSLVTLLPLHSPISHCEGMQSLTDLSTSLVLNSLYFISSFFQRLLISSSVCYSTCHTASLCMSLKVWNEKNLTGLLADLWPFWTWSRRCSNSGSIACDEFQAESKLFTVVKETNVVPRFLNC